MTEPVTVLHSNIIPKSFVHGFPTNKGGVSEGTFSSLNLLYSSKKTDTQENVQTNKTRLAQYAGLPLDTLVVTRCVHGKKVHIVKPNEPLPDQFDAVVTNVKGSWVGALHADCGAILIADPVKMVCAAVHSGWKGTLENIVGETVGVLVNEFGSVPSDLHVAIGPILSVCCFEVGPEVVVQFEEKYPGLEGLVVDGPNKKHVNCLLAIKASLIKAGVSPDKIDTTNTYCTKCDPQNRFFSFRKHGAQFGNHMSYIGIP